MRTVQSGAFRLLFLYYLTAGQTKVHRHAVPLLCQRKEMGFSWRTGMPRRITFSVRKRALPRMRYDSGAHIMAARNGT
jgi:hypothetical protein